MNILLIGNGFDLAHGLPTKYNEFLDFSNWIEKLSECNMSHLRFESELYQSDINKHIISYIINLIDSLLKEMKVENVRILAISSLISNSKNKTLIELIQLIKNNLWIEYFQVSQSLINEGWIDFESEISRVIILCDKYTKQLALLDKGEDKDHWWRISKTLRDEEKADFVKLRTRLATDLKRLIRCLEIYLEEIISKQDVKKLPQFENKHFDYILSFNYTDTYRRLYDSDNTLEYDFIHGKADINNTVESNNMVLGIDEFSNDKSKIQDTTFIQFKKYFQRIHKRTGCTYKKWLNKNQESNLFIFGHSLDVTDKDVLSELITFPNMKTVIYYHNKEAYASQIANLVKVLGKDKLIQMVYGNERTLLFKDFNEAGDDEEQEFLKRPSLLYAPSV